MWRSRNGITGRITNVWKEEGLGYSQGHDDGFNEGYEKGREEGRKRPNLYVSAGDYDAGGRIMNEAQISNGATGYGPQYGLAQSDLGICINCGKQITQKSIGRYYLLVWRHPDGYRECAGLPRKYAEPELASSL